MIFIAKVIPHDYVYILVMADIAQTNTNNYTLS